MAKYKNRSRSLARDRFWSDKSKDQYSCPDCGRGHGEIQGTFEVHHKDGDAYNNSIENLIGLCPLCHKLRENRKPTVDEVERLRDAGAPGRVQQEAPVNELFNLKQDLRTAAMDSCRKYADVEPTAEEEHRLFEAGVAHGKADLRERFEEIIDSTGGLKCSYCGMPAEKMGGELRSLDWGRGVGIACTGCTKAYAWKDQGAAVHATHIESHPKEIAPNISPGAKTAFKKTVALFRAKEFGLVGSDYTPQKAVLSYIHEQYAGYDLYGGTPGSEEQAIEVWEELSAGQIDWDKECLK